MKTLALTALLAFCCTAIAQTSTLPEGVGEQGTPQTFDTPQSQDPFTRKIESTLKIDESQFEAVKPTDETTPPSATTTTRTISPTQTRRELIQGTQTLLDEGKEVSKLQPLKETPYPQKVKGSTYDFSGVRHYRPYKPGSSPHFQYRKNPGYTGTGVSLTGYRQNPAIIISEKEAKENNPPIDYNKFNEERYESIPRGLRKHPAWQSGFYINAPKKKGAK